MNSASQLLARNRRAVDDPVVCLDPWLALGFNLVMNKKIALVLIVLFGAGLALNSFAQTNSTPGAPTAAIVAAAKKFLATIDEEH